MKFVIPFFLAVSLASAIIITNDYKGQPAYNTGLQVSNVARGGGGQGNTNTSIIGMATTPKTNGTLNLIVDTSMNGAGSVVLLETHFDIAGSTSSVITSTNGTWSKVYSYTNVTSFVGSYWLLTNTIITTGTVISNSYTQTASNAVTMTLFALTNQSLAFDVGAQSYVGIGSTTLQYGNTTSTNGWLVGMAANTSPPITNDFSILRTTNVVAGSTITYQWTATNTPTGAFTNHLQIASASSIMGSWLSLKAATSSTTYSNVDTFLDFHGLTINSVIPDDYWKGAYGNTNLYDRISEFSRNYPIMSNVLGPDITLLQPVQTPDGSVHTSTGTNWYRGNFADGNGWERLRWLYPVGSLRVRMKWVQRIYGISSAAQNSRDLMLEYYNPYATAQYNVYDNNPTKITSGVHTSLGGSGQVVGDYPTNTYVACELVEDMANGVAFVTYKNATNGAIIFSSILYGTPDTNNQAYFAINEGYIYNAPIASGWRELNAWSIELNPGTNSSPWMPQTPSGITAAQNGNLSLGVSWIDNSSQLNRYSIDLFTNNTAWWTNAATALPYQTNVTFTGLALTNYQARVRSYFTNLNIASSYATSGSVTITNAPPAPFVTGNGSSPANLTALGGKVGFKFVVGAQNISVTELGSFAMCFGSGWSGATTIPVYLIDDSGTTLSSANVDISALDCSFHWTSITPVTLNAGTTNHVMVDNIYAGQVYFVPLTHASDATLPLDNYITILDVNSIYGTVDYAGLFANFKFQLAP